MNKIRLIAGLLACLAIATVAFAQPQPVNNIPTDRLVLHLDGIEVSTPLVTSHSLDQMYEHITRAVLFVPDTTREIMNRAAQLSDQADTAGVTSTTLLAGLQFLMRPDIIGYGFEQTSLSYWPGTWHSGYQSLSTDAAVRDTVVSSFVFMDSLMYRVADLCPNLETIVVTGGGTYVQRYAAGTAVPDEFSGHIPNDLNYEERPPVVFLPTTINAYLYFNEERPQIIGGWAPLGDLFQQYIQGYNSYPYGLNELNEYMARRGSEDIFERYRYRNVIYAVGEFDTAQNWDNQNKLVQGLTNKMSALMFQDHLRRVFGDMRNHKLLIVEGANAFNILRGPNIREYLFDYVPGNPIDEWSLDVENTETGLADGYAVRSAYPNPFNASTRISVTLARPGDVTLRVFNVLGQEVERLADGRLAAGEHSFVFDATNLASGEYFIHVQSPGTLAELQRVTLVK